MQNIGALPRAFSAADMFFFVQDDLRVTPALTLNIGARVESSSRPSEVQNILSNLDLTIGQRGALNATFAGEMAPSATGSSNRIDPRLNGVTLVDSPRSSIYHALELELLKPTSHGYRVGAAYVVNRVTVRITLSVWVNDSPTFQDPRNLPNNRGNSQFDIGHRFVINHIFEPPWTKGFTGVGGNILGRWGFSGVFSIQSGFPGTLFARRGIADVLLAGASNVTANFSGGAFTPASQGSPAAANIPSCL